MSLYVTNKFELYQSTVDRTQFFAKGKYFYWIDTNDMIIDKLDLGFALDDMDVERVTKADFEHAFNDLYDQLNKLISKE